MNEREDNPFRKDEVSVEYRLWADEPIVFFDFERPVCSLMFTREQADNLVAQLNLILSNKGEQSVRVTDEVDALVDRVKEVEAKA